MNGPLLEIRDLVVRYDNQTREPTGGEGAVAGVSLDVEAGSLTALVGPSGCGKTTLLRAVAGFEVPRAGTVTLDGETLCGPGRWVPPEKRRVGMVFQEGALFPHLDVRGNVGYGLAGDVAAEDKIDRILELVGLPDLGHRYPDELSGGQRQRVALARALAPGPRLVLLDEPFASLDPGLRERVREDVREILGRAGATAVLVTHDREEALSVADRLAVMHRGKILQTGSPADIYHRPANVEVAQFMGEGHLVACHVEGGKVLSPFGRVATAAEDGPVYLYLRPEDLGIHSCDDPNRAHGRIVARRFFGHDVLDRVRLESGEELQVRVLSSVTLPEGAAVELTLQTQNFRLFERTANGS